MADYTYERHVAWMSEWLVTNDFSNLTLVCQDWGGLIGLRLVAAFPDKAIRRQLDYLPHREATEPAARAASAKAAV